jgi:hypothetical protein
MSGHFVRGALFGWESSMTRAEQFRENAEEAMQWCRRSRSEQAKKLLTDLARTWKQGAALGERTIVGPPVRRSQGSEDRTLEIERDIQVI